jgi:cytochrome c553
MNKQLNVLLALVVACATTTAHAQASAPAKSQPPQAGPEAAPKAAAGATSIQAKVAQCAGCHNIKGYQASFPEVYKVPMIAGQNAKYIAAALTAYKNGERKHPTMRGIATSLSEQDINDVAAYYSALGNQPGGRAPAEQPSRQPDTQVSGLLQKAACVSCHGSNFSKPIDPGYPKIAGQHADYLFVAMKAYKTEGSPAFGRNNGVMGAIVKQFSNAELKALAGYVSSLDGEVKTVQESKFR